MWSYFGAKTNIVKFYPPPSYDKIIEPFAGTAKYALTYFDRDVLLIDKYDQLIRIWLWLQQCSKEDILKLPKKVNSIQILEEQFTFDCDEAKWLFGFLVGYGMERPRRTASARRAEDRPNHLNYSLKRIANDLFKIRHWEIRCGSYEDAPDETATWFVDPPYQVGGDSYIYSNKDIDYTALGEWCRTRKGQVIVCENYKANWMNFHPLVQQRVARNNQREVVWSNEPLMVQQAFDLNKSQDIGSDSARSVADPPRT